MDFKTSQASETTPQLRVRCGLRAGQTGGTVSGVYYPDMSGTCAGSTSGGSVIVPSPSGGATIGGVYYPDKSGTCV